MILQRAAIGLLLLILTAGCWPAPDLNDDSALGLLAYVRSDGNVVLYVAYLKRHTAITDDATVAFEGSGISYQRLAWSPSGKLAFASVDRGANSTASAIYVWEPNGGDRRQVAQNSAHFVIFLYWAPGAADRLVYLIETGDTLALTQITIEDQIRSQILGFGKPFYLSWSPQGDQMLWHTGGSTAENRLARITRFELISETRNWPGAAPGQFVAPAWSPADGRWLLGAQDQNGTSLELHDGVTKLTVVETQKSQGDIAFVWSPSGQQIAFAIRNDPLDAFYGPIHIYDLQSQITTELTDASLHIKAFWWSPSGDRLAYLSRLDVAGDEWLQWRIFNYSSRVDAGAALFQPTGHMGFVAAAFNQYAQSHRLWSPDGRYLVYGASDRSGVDAVWLLDTQAREGPEAFRVDLGSMGFWSFGAVDAAPSAEPAQP